MNPFDYSKAFTDFWTAQGQALMRAQQQAGKALTEGMQAVTAGKLPALPQMPVDLSAGATDLAGATKSVMDLWSAATTVCAKLATSIPAMKGGDGVIEATFRKILDPRSWLAATGEMDDVLGRMAEGPRFADLWEAERRYAGVLHAWMNLRRRNLEHNAVVLEAWLQAGRKFTETLAARTEPQTLDPKGALALWTEIANKQLLETQRSEPFLQTQAAMIRATTELRIAQQDMVEHFGKQYGFPTRTEIDDVHRTVTELRREIRAMRQQQRNAPSAPAIAPAEPLQMQPPADPPVAKRAAAKKTPTAKKTAAAKPMKVHT
jgi:hypothetical protein